MGYANLWFFLYSELDKREIEYLPQWRRSADYVTSDGYATLSFCYYVFLQEVIRREFVESSPFSFIFSNAPPLTVVPLCYHCRIKDGFSPLRCTLVLSSFRNYCLASMRFFVDVVAAIFSASFHLVSDCLLLDVRCLFLTSQFGAWMYAAFVAGTTAGRKQTGINY